jgi:hypothetical protein
LDLLIRTAKRVASFSDDCAECLEFQGEIAKLVENLGDLVKASKEERKNYFKMINSIIKHLQQRHELVAENEYYGIWIGIGIAIGAGMGIVFSVGAGIGIAIGTAIGGNLDAKAKKEDKII